MAIDSRHSRRLFLGAAAASLAAWSRPTLGQVRSSRARRALKEQEEWKNWSGLVRWSPSEVARPESVESVVTAVKGAAKAGTGLRVAGTGHSFTPLCATEGTTVLLSRLSGIERIDRTRGVARVLGGTKLYQLHEPLREEGLAFTNLPDIDRQAVAGAIATATHGTGPGLGSLSSQIVGMGIVTATGDLVECSLDDNKELLDAARVSLGAFGVVVYMDIQLVPAFRLHEQSFILSYDQMVEQLSDRISSNRHFEFFWVSDRDACLGKQLNPTGEMEDMESFDDETRLTGQRVGHSGDIFPSLRNTRFNEIEYSVPLERGPECFAEIRKLMLGKHKTITWPLEYRTVAAESAHLSMMHARPTVTLSLHQAANLDHEGFFDDVEAISRNHGGRPHWGKLHSLRAEQLAELYPRFEDWNQIRRELDPTGVFSSAYLKKLFEA